MPPKWSTTRTTYTYGLGLISERRDDREEFYYHYNHNGSTVAVSDAGGNILYRFTYDTYGELSDITTDDGISLKTTENTAPADTTAPAGMTAGYTLAQLADAAGIDYLYNGQYGVITDRNGLYYMRARYYDQDIKRFTNRDVVSGDITNSRSLNRYCYVQGNPVSLTDPFGLCPDPNSNFKNFCRTLYCVDWNAVGHGALDVMGIFCDGADVLNAIWYACEGKTKEALTSALCALPGLGMGIGSIMEKTSKFAQAGKTVKYLSKMAQGGMGVVAGISMAKTGFTNILNGLESGNLSGWDIVTFIGGIAITGLSGRNLAISGRGLAGMMDDAGKVAKAGKAEKVESELVVRDTKFLDADGNIDWEKWAPNGGRVAGTIKENQTIPAGTIIDRYGSQWGKYTSPAGVPYEQRALPYIENPNAYHKYEVLKPIDNVTISEIAPAFEQVGGGIQYELPNNIKKLKELGYIREIK